MKFIGLQNVFINVEGKSVKIEEGELYDFKLSLVDDAVRGNYIKRYQKPRARRAAAKSDEDAPAE